MENKYHIEYKTLWEKEKLLGTSDFSFSHNVFHSYIYLVRQNASLYGNRLMCEPFSIQALVFTCLQYKSLKNTVVNREIACKEQFLLFPLFSILWDNFLPSLSVLQLSSTKSFILEESKICCLGNG